MGLFWEHKVGRGPCSQNNPRITRIHENSHNNPKLFLNEFWNKILEFCHSVIHPRTAQFVNSPIWEFQELLLFGSHKVGRGSHSQTILYLVLAVHLLLSDFYSYLGFRSYLPKGNYLSVVCTHCSEPIVRHFWS